MAPESNFYVTEAVLAAMASATQRATATNDEKQAVAAMLKPVREILEVHAVVFYIGGPGGHQAFHSDTEPGRMMRVPQEISGELAAYVRAAQRVVTSEDAVFQIGHLRMLPATSAASSVWVDVKGRDQEFGILAAFDASDREFRKAEQEITKMFGAQIALCLELIRERKSATATQTQSTSTELNRYLEATQVVGNVARDLINPLTAMLGYIELMRGGRLDDEIRNYLDKLQLQAEKTQQMVMALNSSSHAAPMLLKAHIEPMAIAKAPVSAPMPVPPPLPRARVLIVQKNEATLEFKKSVLSTLHADLVTTFTGSDAIQLLQNEDVHAVIVDDELEGEWPGRKLYGWICEHRPDLRDRVLLTVSTRPKPDIQELIEESHVPHVSKPLQIVELFTGVQHILGQREKKTVQ
jgi:DNA-binding response OmpR family regulator